jgi:uncharacterized protein (DUF305 family)
VCGGQTTPASGLAATSTSAPSAASSSANNDADVTFVKGMTPHHGQAVDMAKLAATNTSNPKILDLAGRIENAQAPEIQTMNGFLTSWGMTPDTSGGMGGMGGMDHGSTDGMGGMMSADQMQQLTRTRGAEFDRMFLTMMIQHHEGAVQMAKTEIASGQSADAKALAQKIIEAQQGESSEMNTLLTTV